MNLALIMIASAVGALATLRSDVRRRRLTLNHSEVWQLLTALDVLAPALTIAAVVASVVCELPVAISQHVILLNSPLFWVDGAGLVIFLFLWSEGRRQLQFQRPRGIVFGELLILGGTSLLAGFALRHAPGTFRMLSAIPIIAGGGLIAAVVTPFVRVYEGHRILDQREEQLDLVQTEYTPPTAECPRPELWSMVDSQTTELEIIDLLKALVVAMKPGLIVETGTFLGYSTIKMAEGLKQNGFGRIVTVEYDPAIFAKAKQRIDSSGLGRWIDNRHGSSLEVQIEGTIDLLFSDSHLDIREAEIRRLLPQVDPRGLILIHDASSHFEVVREAALRMEKEGLISVVMLSTPRGLVIAQKREGRK